MRQTTSQALSPFDLVRNDVFHRARKTGEDDEKLFDLRWKFFEHPFWNEQVRQGRLKHARADHLIAHTVMAETARDVNVGKIATEYQHYARERNFQTVAAELDVLLTHAATYRTMKQRDQDAVYARITEVLRIWDVSTFHPVILWINAQSLEDQEKSKLFNLMESYLVRREICGLTTKNYNKVVIGLIREAREHKNVAEGFENHLLSLAGDASRMPADAQVAEAFLRRKAYGVTPTPRLRYILQQIEYAKRSTFDEVTVSTENLTIDHIMPQRWAEHWPLPNGETAPCESIWEASLQGHEISDETKALMQARQQVVDSLGNLTLITASLNPSLGKCAWETKRERLGGSLLAINREIACKPAWNETAIAQRAGDLADVVNVIWKAGST